MPEKKEKEKTPKTKRPMRGVFFLKKESGGFIENASLLISSGMTVSGALEAASADTHSKRMRRIVAQIAEDVASGFPLWRALAETGLFAPHTVSLIKIGEESGKLAENLRIVSAQQEKERVFRAQIQSATMYPAFVFALSVAVGVGIAWFILPRLATVFAELRVPLPLITRILIGVGLFLGAHGATAVPIALAGLGVIAALIFLSPKTKRVGMTALFWFPGIARLLQDVEITRFGYLAGTLLKAGLPITDTLESLSHATQNPRYKKLYAHLAQKIDEGNSFQKSFTAYPGIARIVPVSVTELIASGEQSGTLAETLLTVSARYAAKTEIATKNLAVILEPVLLVVVWLGVLAVALAVILPIYSLIGGLQMQ